MNSFKDLFFNPVTLRQIADNLARVERRFDKNKFLKRTESQIVPLELKDRVRLITQVLADLLPQDYPKAVEILIAALEPESRRERDPKQKSGLHGFNVWPLTYYVQEQGLDHFEVSLQALKEMTKCFTAEFAIRPFLIRHEEKTLAVLTDWAQDPNHHVRRLVSEGSRPRLPWGERLPEFIKHPQKTLSLLERLKYDDEEYVRRSVANHLNDVTKDHPRIVTDLLSRWLKETPEAKRVNSTRLARHACRSLLKLGNPGAMKIFGYSSKPKVSVKSFEIEKRQVKEGDHLPFKLSLRSESKRSQKIMVDYAIHHVKAQGHLTKKVFKFSSRELKPGELWELKSRHSFKTITTRTYHSGRHVIEILVNGFSIVKMEFDLKAEKKSNRVGSRRGRGPMSRSAKTGTRKSKQ